MRYSIISDQVDEDFEIACKIISEQGYKEIEIHNVFNKSIEQCSIEEAYQIKKIIDTYGLKVSNIATTVFFLCPLKEHYTVSLFNPEFYCIEGDVNTHLAYLQQACEIANILDCQTIRVFPFRFPDNEEVVMVGNDEDLALIANNLKQACEVVAPYGKTIVLENCPYSHCPKGEMTNELYRRVNHPNMKLLWDPANSYRAMIEKVPSQYLGLSLEEEFALVKEKIGHIHFKNYEYQEGLIKPFVHKSLTEGDIDYTKIVTLCTTLGNEVCLSLEPEVNYDECIKSMKQLKGLL